MKPKKRQNKRTTLDKQHFQKIREFDKNLEKVSELKKKVKTLKKELYRIENEKDVANYTNQDIIRRAHLKDEIDYLLIEIDNIDSGKNELIYLKQVDDIMDEYFGKNNKENDIIELNIMDFMKVKNRKEKIQEITSGNKVDLYNEYLDRVDNKNIMHKKKPADICDDPECKGQLLVGCEDGTLICNKCGIVNGILIDAEKTGNKESNNEKTVYAYKRLNHLKEIINQIQGQETVDIKDSIYSDITLEISRKKMNKKDIDFFKMKKILKKLGYDKLYEHTSYIVWRICGIPPPVFPRFVIDRIEKMFNMIQKPFEMFRPSNRKNFLSYAYVLHKFFDMMEMPEYLVYFKLLKNRKKLREQEKVFKQICEYLKWPFKPSIS